MTADVTAKAAWLKSFERFMVVVGVVGPFSTAPQLVKLYHTHTEHAAGLSLSTWLAYLALSVLWTVYGVVNKKAPIWIGNSIGMVLNLLMVVGIAIHAGATY